MSWVYASIDSVNMSLIAAAQGLYYPKIRIIFFPRVRRSSKKCFGLLYGRPGFDSPYMEIPLLSIICEDTGVGLNNCDICINAVRLN